MDPVTNLPSWAKPVQQKPLDVTRTPFEEEEELEIPSWASRVQQVQPEEIPEETQEELPSWATPVRQEDTWPTAPVDDQPYGPSDLLEPTKLARVDGFLNSYYGVSEIDGYTPEERVEKFLNTFRYLESGNTVKTLGFVDHVLSTDEFGRKSVADGYDLFAGLAGVTSDEYTWGETLGAIKDYAVGAIVDPVNIFAPLVGKIVGQTGTTATNRAVLALARREASRLSALGASEAVQAAAASKIKGEAIKALPAATLKRQAYKEVMGATGFDIAVAAGTDIAYQHGLIKSGAQEQQDRMQTGLAALGGLVGGGVAAAGLYLRGTSKLGMANTDVAELSVEQTADLTGVLRELSDSLENLPKNDFVEVFGDKVARGVEIEEADTRFWGVLLAGDDPTGFKGLGQIMYDKGFRYLGKRNEGDNFSNWLADAMKNAPEEEITRFVKVFQEKTGVTFKGMDANSIDSIADNMSRKMSDSGFALGKMGQVAKMLRFRDIKDVTVEDYYAHLFGDITGGTLETTKKSWIETKAGEVGSFTNWFQDSYIRLLVTHPGTSALNVVGWSAKTAGQSASDILRATVIYGGNSAFKLAKGQGAESVVSWQKMTGAYKANYQKMKNLIDPYTTADAFNSLVDRHPQAFKDVVGVLPGGVVRPVARQFGIGEPTEKLYEQTGEKVINSLQTLALVKAQDVFTKSQEVMYNLDIALRESMLNPRTGKPMGYIELLQQPDASVLMSSKQFQSALSKANDRTLENILSKSYANQDNLALKRVAGFIEDFRSIPVVGATIPFGRFFNNVVATVSEYSGGHILLKATGTGAQNKDAWEVMTKAAVGWTAAAMLVEREKELLQRGVAWDEDIVESTGERVSDRYDAPFIGVKAIARWKAHMELDGEVPTEFIEDASKAIFGQLTRQLSESGDAFIESVYSLLSGDMDAAASQLLDMSKSVGSTIVSGSTRFLEPVNTLVALSNDPQEYMAEDVKTGNAGFAKSFRYIDQFIGETIKGEVMERNAPTSEYVSRQPGRIVGQRPQGPTTNAGRVFAMIGRPSWDADLFSGDPVATNIVVGEFQPIFDRFAERLLDNKAFTTADLKTKQLMVSEQLKRARDLTHRTLRASTNPDNPRQSLIFKLTENRSVEDIEKLMGEMGIEGEIQDLTSGQLSTLKYFLDNDDDLRIRRQINTLKP